MEKKTHLIANNNKAHHNYFLSDFIECGIVLTGTEIKSLRNHGASLVDSYILFRNGEAYIFNMHIAPYEKGNIFNHEPRRTRKLLLHKLEIRKYDKKVREKCFTVVPTKLYFKGGRVKVEIALAKGKKLYDKREVSKQKDIKRELDKARKEANNRG